MSMLKRLPLYPITTEVSSQGHLVVGGCDTVELADEFGTPLYLFDEIGLRNKCCEFREEFGKRYPNVLVIYASKAYANAALERIFDEAMTPKLRRIVWFPVSKAPDGSVTYGQKEVYGPDLRAAIAALRAVPREIDEASFLYYKPPVSVQGRRIRDYEGEFLKKALRKLDLTFGLK